MARVHPYRKYKWVQPSNTHPLLVTTAAMFYVHGVDLDELLDLDKSSELVQSGPNSLFSAHLKLSLDVIGLRSIPIGYINRFNHPTHVCSKSP